MPPLGDRAAEADVPVSVEIYDGMQHLFQADRQLCAKPDRAWRVWANFIRTRTKSPATCLRGMAGE